MGSHNRPPPSATKASIVEDAPEDGLMADPTSVPCTSNSALEIDSSFSAQDDSDAHSMASNLCSTHSVASNVYEFVEEHGRTYHKYKQGKYVLPNDTEEQNRLDLQHHMALKVLDGKLHLAPIPNTVENTLDVATGTGIWAIEFAEQYPSTSVTGSDLSPIQPK